MDDHSMRRYVPLLIAGAALIAAACSDSTAPTRSTYDPDHPVLTALGSGTFSSYRRQEHVDPTAEANAATFTFSISPTKGAMVKVGTLYLYFPDRAVCDPTKSSYGPTEWDASCETLKKSITVTAKFWVEDGRTHADFTPNLRFAPDRGVYIGGYVPEIIGREATESLADKYAVYYAVLVGDTRYLINEAAVDPTLATVIMQKDGLATGGFYRRIKHFSGYYVRSGRVCDEETGECSGDTAVDY
jgi:hypothetical protein